MHYVAIVDGQEREIEITELAADRYRLVIDGRAVEVDARLVSDSAVSLLLDDQAYNIEIERTPEGIGNVLVRGHVVGGVEVLDLRKMRLRKAQEMVVGPQGPITITSPMPGKVVAILVKEGQSVVEGQGVVVVEAMKMENELKSPKDGVVVQLSAQLNAAVESGAALCRIE